MVLKDLQGQPVRPLSTCLVRCQGPVIRALKPAAWFRKCTGFTQNHARVEWKIDGVASAEVRKVLHASCADAGNFEALGQPGLDGQPFTADFYTPMLQWLDSIHIQFRNDEAGNTMADAWSGSAAVCPASCCCSPCCSAICCCIPFIDHGKNLLHLQQLRAMLEAKGFKVEEKMISWGAATKPDQQTMA